MKLTFDRARWSEDGEGFWLCLRVKLPKLAREFVAGLKERLYDAELKEHRERRSLDANAYLWVLLGKLAEALHTDKDDVYLMMLERYGVYTHIIVRPELVERVRGEWRTVRELGPVAVNGRSGVQLQCYFGSHTYDTKEMSRLLEGVVEECRELDIETLPPEKLEAMEVGWACE